MTAQERTTDPADGEQRVAEGGSRVVGGVAVVALLHLGALPVLPGDAGLPAIVALESLSLLVLGVATYRTEPSRGSVGAIVLFAGVGAAVAFGLAETVDRRWVVAVALASVAIVAAAGLRRYELFVVETVVNRSETGGTTDE